MADWSGRASRHDRSARRSKRRLSKKLLKQTITYVGYNFQPTTDKEWKTGQWNPEGFAGTLQGLVQNKSQLSHGKFARGKWRICKFGVGRLKGNTDVSVNQTRRECRKRKQLAGILSPACGHKNATFVHAKLVDIFVRHLIIYRLNLSLWIGWRMVPLQVLLRYNMSFKTIAGGFNGAF